MPRYQVVALDEDNPTPSESTIVLREFDSFFCDLHESPDPYTDERIPITLGSNHAIRKVE